MQQDAAQRRQQALKLRVAEGARAQHRDEEIVPEQGRRPLAAEAARGCKATLGSGFGQRIVQRPGAGEVAQRQLGDELAIDDGVGECRPEPRDVERRIRRKVAADGQQGQPAGGIGHPGVDLQGLGEARGGRPAVAESLLDDGQVIAVPGIAAVAAHGLGEIEPGGVEVAEVDGGGAALGPVGLASPRCAGCRHRAPIGSARSGRQTEAGGSF